METLRKTVFHVDKAKVNKRQSMPARKRETLIGHAMQWVATHMHIGQEGDDVLGKGCKCKVIPVVQSNYFWTKFWF